MSECDSFVTIYTVVFNEAFMLPLFARHYRAQFTDLRIVVFDNGSTDATVSVAKDLGCDVRCFATDGMDDLCIADLKSSCLKMSRSPWTIIVDCDEWCAIDETSLAQADFNIVKFRGWEMFDDVEHPGLAEWGCVDGYYSKPSCFRTECFDDLRVLPGAHRCRPVMRPGHDLCLAGGTHDLFHLKWWNFDYGLSRAQLLSSRQSERNLRYGYSKHLSRTADEHRLYYDAGISRRIRARDRSDVTNGSENVRVLSRNQNAL
jgi:glycosyltransferase involved in cell wall biosynthesis